MSEATTAFRSDETAVIKVFDDCRCTHCGEAGLEMVAEGPLTCADAIRCPSCGASFDRVFGVPYLGGFEADDFLGLIEIVAGLRTRADFRDGEWCLREEASQQDGIDAIDALFRNPAHLHDPRQGAAGPLPLRLAMLHAALRTWGDVAFDGRKVLDVGAGTGFDSLYYLGAGAEVTALEFSPVLAGAGQAACPRIRWVGGSGQNLPFADESFDIAVANAAVHHFGDPLATLSEMLRVLRPQGQLFTISDSFCPDTFNELEEARVFDGHPDVMSGVNEQLLRLGPILHMLHQFGDAIDVMVLTDTVDGFAPDPRAWSLQEALTKLPAYSGSFSLRIRKKARTTHKSKPRCYALSPTALLGQATDVRKVLAGLSGLAPASIRDADVLSEAHPKLRLLTGWNLPDGRSDSRGAYGDATLFVSGAAFCGKELHCSVLLPWLPEGDNPVLRFLLDGVIFGEVQPMRGVWTPVSISVPPSADVLGMHLFTISLVTDSPSDAARRYRVTRMADTPVAYQPAGIENYGIDTLFRVAGLAGEQPVLIAGGAFQGDVEALMRLAPWHDRLHVMVPETQIPLYDWLKGVRRISSYSRGKPALTGEETLVMVSAQSRLEAWKLSEALGLRDGGLRSIHGVFSDGHADKMVACRPGRVSCLRKSWVIGVLKAVLRASLPAAYTHRLRRTARCFGLIR